jgi:hypothetical protein
MNWIPQPPSLAIAPDRFAHATVVDHHHPQRAEIEAFISGIYRKRFNAHLRAFLPDLIAYHTTDGELVAAVGFRMASNGHLFFEQYLDAPVEQVLSAAGIEDGDRRHLVEVGNFAACAPGVARELIIQLARVLDAAGIRWVLFVATRELRNAFSRLHLRPMDLGAADGRRLGNALREWGSYYDTQPRLMCGDIREGLAFLGRQSDALQRARHASARPIRSLSC